MTKDQIAVQIKNLLHSLPAKYYTKEEQLLYQQGILIGLLSSLSYDDSSIYSKTRRKLRELNESSIDQELLNKLEK